MEEIGCYRRQEKEEEEEKEEEKENRSEGESGVYDNKERE